MNTELPDLLMGKKASVAFSEYIEPYLEKLITERPDSSLEELNMALRIPWMIWNACVAKNSTNNTVDYLGSIKLLTNNSEPEAKRMLNDLKVRKQKHFSQYNYLLGDVTLYSDKKTNEVRMKAEARDPSSPSTIA